MSNYAYMFDEDYIIRHRKQKNILEMRSFHYHQAYEILYIINGKKNYIDTTGYYELTSGTVALTLPNAIHKTSDKEICEKITFYFTQNYLSKNFTKEAQELLLRCFNKKIIRINENDIFTNMCIDTVESSDQKSLFHIYTGRILKYLTEISLSHSEQIINYEPRITAILKYIQNNSNSIKSIDEIADKFGITKFHLCRLFRDELDTTVIQYLNAIRIQNMCNMLINSQFSVAECSNRCGFNSSEYAARVFSGVMHISPTEYRKERAIIQ